MKTRTLDTQSSLLPPAGPDSVLPERTVYSVSGLNRDVRTLLESGIGLIWVEGEISNLSRPSSGHWYFSLKDRDAQVRCAMFRTRNQLVRFAPREGQLVQARARVSLYEPRGEYQLVAELMEDAGEGALQRAFEQLKQRLAAEGLFAAERKRELPTAPRRIGVVTSPTGAAIRDVLNILRRRYPAAAVLIYPVPVQGAAAAPAIVAALERAATRAECDVLIVARGGGSLEDLWAFNDERVARAIFACHIPIVSGVGHEIDFTIADFVADVRAPTPSGAAELVAPDTRAWLQRLSELRVRFVASMRRQLGDERSALTRLQRRLQLGHPGARLSQLSQRLDDLEGRLQFALQSRLQSDTLRLRNCRARLRQAQPGIRLTRLAQRMLELDGRLQFALKARVRTQSARLQTAVRALQAVSPLATLARGFAIVTRGADGALVTSASQLQAQDDIDIRLADGALRARVLEPRS